MSDDGNSLVTERFAALVPAPMQSDWLDVQRRARHMDHRRRWLVVAIAAALAVLLIGSALGSRRMIRFFDAAPAPDRAVAQFEDARRSMRAHFGIAYPEVADELRTVFRFQFQSGSRGSIALAPTSDGFCSVISSRDGGFSGAGCDGAEASGTRSPISFAPIPHLGKGPSGESLGMHGFIGTLTDPATERFVLRYEDGAQDDVPFTWVSEPIDAGFFAFDPSPEHYGAGHRASTFIALDAEGAEVARTRLAYGRAPRDEWTFPQGSGMPPAVDPATVHRLPTPRLPRWLKVDVGRSTSGGRCFRVAYDIAGGCRKPGATFECCQDVRSYGQTILGRPRLIALLQGFMADDAELELSFEDGKTVVVQPREQVVLYAIPPEAFQPGHRLLAGDIHKKGSGRVTKKLLFDGWLARPYAPGGAVLESVRR